MGRKPKKKQSTRLDVGTIFQKKPGGNFYYRYQVSGTRHAVSLKTTDEKEARREAEKYIPVIEAPSAEVISVQVQHAKRLSKNLVRLPLQKAWAKYAAHPDRARPATVNIYLRYESYFSDFVDWAVVRKLEYLDEVTDEVVDAYAEHLKTLDIGVDTHNKRIARIAHVFQTLADYTTPETSDWRNPNFKRKAREENGIEARRLPFTKEQEEAIFAVLADPTLARQNKRELSVLFHLGAYTGQRMKDCALLQWHSVDLKRQRITVKQFKTGKEATIPIAPQLLAALNEAQPWKIDTYVLPHLARRYLKKNDQGKDVGGALVDLDVLRVIKAAGIDTNQEVPGRKRNVTVYGFHSLRHAFVSFCSEKRVPKAVVMSIVGADSKIIDTYYTHVGDEAQEQAIQAISGNSTSLRQRYDEALKFLAGLEEKSKDVEKLEKILRG